MSNMNDSFLDDILGGEDEGTIPVNDKRRFNADGERMAEDPAEEKGSGRSAMELVLEAALKAEIERREAAEAKLIGVQAKFEEAKAGLEKETADMRARLMKTLEDRAKQSQFNFLTTLLPVLDNLNRAVDASASDSSVDNLRNGVIGTARSFEQALLSVGVEAVPAVGATFDPEVHEAIDIKEVDGEHDGKVTAQYSPGYKFGSQLLRPAKVQVGKGLVRSAGE